jgi:hypothetical protein
METETHSEKRVREYWAKAYDANAKNKNASIYNIGSLDFTKNNDDNDNQLPYEPSAVLAKAPSNQPRKRSIYNISSLDFTT